MTELRSTGYFRELEIGDPSGPSLRDSVTDARQRDVDRIVEYLDSSPILMWSPVLVYDVLDPETVIGSVTIHSDGVWEWPADLVYYVRQYHVPVDAEFVAHMAARAWTPPAPNELDVDVAELLGVEVDRS